MSCHSLFELGSFVGGEKFVPCTCSNGDKIVFAMQFMSNGVCNGVLV